MMIPMAPWPALLYAMYVQASANTFQLPTNGALDLARWGLSVSNDDTVTLLLT